MADVFCPLCVDGKARRLHAYKNRAGRFLTALSLFECMDCHLVFAYPMPDPSTLDRYYGKGEYHRDKTSFTPEFSNFSKYLSRSRVDFITRHGSLPDHVLCLDIGAGNALFGAALKQARPNAVYHAVEPGPGCRQTWGDWVDLSFEALEQVGSTQYSLIVLNQVLEHVAQPREFLQSVSQHLAAGGLLYIDVPNRDDRYKNSVEPHLLFWQKASLIKALALSGLRARHADTAGMPQEEATRFFSSIDASAFGARPRVWLGRARRVFQWRPKGQPTDHLERFQADCYGGSRQWLRCLAEKPGNLNLIAAAGG